MPRQTSLHDRKLELRIHLSALGAGRQHLTKAFLDKDPEVFKPMFKYEKRPALMQFAVEKYLTGWLDQHWPILEGLLRDEQISETHSNRIWAAFARHFGRLLTVWTLDTESAYLSDFCRDLIQRKARSLEQILACDDLHSRRLGKMEYSYERDKALFQRQMDCMERKKDVDQ